ncbi:MAG: methionine--tRNA ligase [Candidatus Micrarchaeota archaeon]|nr:methionine--tRNA ligase [Candidatus Micrarchaeota archaeon]
MNSRKFYITTAIPYVNAAPHIGHALEFIQADAIARHRKVNGYDVFLTTGADENSLKTVQAAEKLGISTNQLIDRNAQAFREMAEKVGLEYDAFARSSIKEEHWAGVEKIWNLCNKSGDIYKKSYKGLYCVGCEQFYTEKELENGLCPEHKTRPELVEEENYFFRLSKYQKQIEDLIVSGKLKIIPDNRKNEVLTFIREGLEDFSVSRSVKRAKGWGVPVPGDLSQIIYVWFDALGLYLTGVGYGKDDAKFAKWWPADIHVIGKGIIKFHALYWPGILLSAGIAMPKAILVHGYVTAEGQKMSKSIGNIVDPIAVVDKYGADKIRYYLLKEIQTFEDGDFSEKALIESINNELVGNIGNFIHRTLTFVWAKFGGTVKSFELSPEERVFIKNISAKVAEVDGLLGENKLREGMLKILEIGNDANRYFQANAPWELIKSDKEKAERVMFVCTNVCRIISGLLYPYTPESSRKLLEIQNEKPMPFERLLELKDAKINEPYIVFDKIQVEVV